LNILTIHAIRNTLSLPKPLQTWLLSLAVSDLGVGLLVQPLFIALMINPTNSTRTAFNIIVLLFGNASFFGVVAITVDRFLAVHLHLRYQETCNSQVCRYCGNINLGFMCFFAIHFDGEF